MNLVAVQKPQYHFCDINFPLERLEEIINKNALAE